jgi:HEXXH motif-containing protein
MIADLVEAAIDSPSGWSYPGLVGKLASARWRAIQATMGLTRADYGTVRYLVQDPRARRDDLTIVPVDMTSDAAIVVEALDAPRRAQYADFGLDFYASGEIGTGLIRRQLRGALRRLAEVPEAIKAVAELAVVLHVLKPAGPSYDVSYSDPLLPFSVFIGFDSEDLRVGDLRLAEGILHECMHLQLTLIEEIVPIVMGAQERHHSPWQGTMRPLQGILHGLYVFRAIQGFYRKLLDLDSCSADERTYLANRIKSIAEEIATIGDLSTSTDLTGAGKRLAFSLRGG